MITDIEKCAKLMGYEVDHVSKYGAHIYHEKYGDKALFNPRTNKADLMDLECELGIDVEWDDSHSGSNVKCTKRIGSKFAYIKLWLANHPTKFDARAESVISVCVQIYDAKYGKDGE